MTIYNNILDDTIDQHLAGRRIRHVWTDGKRLVVETECGHFVNIVWRDDQPRLMSVDVKFELPMPEDSMFGQHGLVR